MNREILGRWHAASSSDEYIRTSSKIVLQLQKTAVRGLAGTTELCRAGIHDLFDFLQSQGYPEEVRRAQEKKLLLTLAAVAASQPSSVASDAVSDHSVLVAPEVVLATCPAGSEDQ